MQPRSPARRQSPPPSIPERYKLDHILFTFLSQPTTPKKNEVENKTRYVFSSSRVALPPAVCQFLCLSIFTPRTPDVPKKRRALFLPDLQRPATISPHPRRLIHALASTAYSTSNGTPSASASDLNRSPSPPRQHRRHTQRRQVDSAATLIRLNIATAPLHPPFMDAAVRGLRRHL
jgi:hypothetical protein